MHHLCCSILVWTSLGWKVAPVGMASAEIAFSHLYIFYDLFFDFLVPLISK